MDNDLQMWACIIEVGLLSMIVGALLLARKMLLDVWRRR
jgi:hypothetical protein